MKEPCMLVTCGVLFLCERFISAKPPRGGLAEWRFDRSDMAHQVSWRITEFPFHGPRRCRDDDPGGIQGQVRRLVDKAAHVALGRVGGLSTR